jgi:uncharacterized membrane protein
LLSSLIDGILIHAVVLGITNGWCNDGIVKTDMCRQEWLSFLALRMVRNMLGTMIRANLLTVKTSNKMDNFAIPVRKNGTFDEIHFWLGVALPLNLSSSR